MRKLSYLSSQIVLVYKEFQKYCRKFFFTKTAVTQLAARKLAPRTSLLLCHGGLLEYIIFLTFPLPVCRGKYLFAFTKKGYTMRCIILLLRNGSIMHWCQFLSQVQACCFELQECKNFNWKCSDKLPINQTCIWPISVG